MTVQNDTISDDWKKNWQQSIAVKISAVVLWPIVPVTLMCIFYYLHNIETGLKTEFEYNADVISYSLLDKFPALFLDPNYNTDVMAQKVESLGFLALVIQSKSKKFVIGNPVEKLTIIQRTIYNIWLPGTFEKETISLHYFYPPLKLLVDNKRKQLLIPIIILLLVFGLFLIWAIKATVHKPLQTLVDATRRVSLGDDSIRLDATRQDEFGAISRFFNQMLDELFDKQKKLQSAVTDAKMANKAKSSFLANMSHELRTPLNAIIGYSEILSEDARILHEDTMIPDLDNIQVAARYLLGLINNVLDISKIEAGKIETFVERIDIKSFIREIEGTVHPIVLKNNNTLKVKIKDKVGSIDTDVTKLRQSLLNLLSNASKFTHDGTITITVELKLESHEEYLVIKVSDSGCGIDDEDINKLFVAFSQGKVATTNKLVGTGLGLAISQHFCQILGGNISVRSSVGKGSTFTLQIPTHLSKTPKSSS